MCIIPSRVLLWGYKSCCDLCLFTGRILGFFMSTLANPQLAQPPPLDEMLSWTVLTPCYEEDVLYPLDARSTAAELGILDPALQKGLTDLVTESEDRVCTMAYLR